MTVYLDQLEYNPLDMWNIKQIWDMSTIYKSDDYWTNVIGFSPGQIFEEIFDVKYRDKQSGLSVVEQLYTAHGSQGVGTYYTTAQEQEANANPKDFNELFYLFCGWQDSLNPSIYKFRTLWTLDASPPGFFS